ncbi:GGDEF domain-containing protein [Denitromonas ohlonensis]|uniref:GGDEF domain-containing protein n=3 Tax=Denitromonas TaxID=139331 RepID=A0A557SP35_9RHOO|nr:GGDEF domain-containing protein [Denitromonas ohlonensis]TVO79183.1 GGDEF domain-containing protein [Denitromonas ohlonensis]
MMAPETFFPIDERPMPRLHPLTLRFHDPALENAYDDYVYPRMLVQWRAALVIGPALYVLLFVLDGWYIPEAERGALWAIRLGSLIVPISFIAITFTRYYRRCAYLLPALNGLTGGLGLIAMMQLMPLEVVAQYYPVVVVVTFFTYNFSGTRFIYALAVDLVLLVTYNLCFGALVDYPGHLLATQDFFIISANLIGGGAGYMVELQRRRLFVHKQALEDERRLHLDRALHDSLTGLPNRELLYDRINLLLAGATRSTAQHALYFVDLNDFKPINDVHGHAVGDQTLRRVAARLRQAVRDADTVARLGGDEFVVLVPQMPDATAAHLQAERIQAMVARRDNDLPESISLSASVGLCLFPYPGATADDIIHRADLAMYHHKASGTLPLPLADPQTAAT